MILPVKNIRSLKQIGTVIGTSGEVVVAIVVANCFLQIASCTPVATFIEVKNRINKFPFA